MLRPDRDDDFEFEVNVRSSPEDPRLQRPYKPGAYVATEDVDPLYVDPMRFGETEFNPTRCDAYDLNWRTTIKVRRM